jgi:hypothetical protein
LLRIDETESGQLIPAATLRGVSPAPDLADARAAARELHEAIARADQVAIDRVLAAHPKYAGRPAERVRIDMLRLRDAQAVIARERGFEDWRALVGAYDGSAERWHEPQIAFHDRAHREATEHGYYWLGGIHLMLALLNPPAPTLAQEVLEGLSLRYDELVSRRPGPQQTSSDEPVVPNPWFYKCVSFANALALSDGVAVRDEHLLLALAYFDEGSELTDHDVDPDEVYDALVTRGVAVPPLRPGIAATPIGPFGPRVYFAGDDFSVVIEAFSEQFPPGTAHWGWNVSQWRPGLYWIDSEDEIDAAAIARGAVSDAALVDVVDFMMAVRAENEAYEASR